MAGNDVPQEVPKDLIKENPQSEKMASAAQPANLAEANRVADAMNVTKNDKASLPGLEVTKSTDVASKSNEAAISNPAGLSKVEQNSLPQSAIPSKDFVASFQKAMSNDGTKADVVGAIEKLQPAVKATENHITGLNKKIESGQFTV